MITYNHERFIAQALESVLMQETDFPVELVIGEDSSSDGTRAIVVEYAQRYPDRIRPLLRERNLGMIPNFVATLQACRGKYVAMLEGDDYWTDPHKLQKQVKFLEAHPECSTCFHNVWVRYEDSGRPPEAMLSLHQKPVSSLDDVLRGQYLPTCSMMFRNGLVDMFPEWFYHLPTGDWPLTVLIVEHGDVGYLNETMAVYRVHTGGTWSPMDLITQCQKSLQAYKIITPYIRSKYGGKYDDAIHEGVSKLLSYQYTERSLERYLNEDLKMATQYYEQMVEEIKTIDDRWIAWFCGVAWRNEKRLGFTRVNSFVHWSADVIFQKTKNRALVRGMLGEWYAGHAFQAYSGRDPEQVWRCATRALFYNPALVRNRGIWSILLRSLGRGVTG